MDSIVQQEEYPAYTESNPALVADSGWRERIALVNRQALAIQLHGRNTSANLRLHLFSDRDYLFDTLQVVQKSDHVTHWRGQLHGLPAGRAYLVTYGHPMDHDLTLAGVVQVGHESFTLNSAASGQVRITQMGGDSAALGCATVEQLDHGPALMSVDALSGDPALADADPDPDPDPLRMHALQQLDAGSVADIHVVMLYPNATVIAAGGEAKLRAKVALAEWLANAAFVDSKIAATVRITLVAEPAIPWTAYVTSVKSVLNNIVGSQPDVALAARVRAHLDEQKADIAAILIPFSTSGTGVTFAVPEPPSSIDVPLKERILALTLTRISSQGPQTDVLAAGTLTHELGHLLGAYHDRFTESRLAPLRRFDYVRGYTPEDRTFTTIMGYVNAAYGTVRVNMFSSPDLSWQGRPLGVPRGQPNAADAASFLRLSVHIVSQYKKRATTTDQDYVINLDVTPELAGFVEPDSLGPYPPHTKVHLKARARSADYVFRQWLIDGNAVAGATTPELDITVDANHYVQAQFDIARRAFLLEASTNMPEVHLDVSPKQMLPAHLAPGTAVKLQVLPFDQPNTNRIDIVHALLYWEVNGQQAWFQPDFWLEMYQDVQVRAVLGHRVHELRYRTVPDNEIRHLRLYTFADNYMDFTNQVADGQQLNWTAEGSFSHWRVDGRIYDAKSTSLTLAIHQATMVEACFADWDRSMKLTVTSNLPILPWIYWDNSPQQGEEPWDERLSTENPNRVHENATEHVFFFRKGTVVTLKPPRTPEPRGAHHTLVRATVGGQAITLADEQSWSGTISQETHIHFEYAN